MSLVSALLLVLMVAADLPAEIIDRIAVAVDRRVITESEIVRQIRLTAFLNDEQPDLSASNKRATADRLVEQVLIRRELETSRYTTAAASSEMYRQVRQRFGTEAAYNQALNRYGITDQDVRDALQWQADLLAFVDMRFRPGVQIPQSELRDYYDVQASENPGKLPPFEEARSDIERILTEQRVDNALDRWLGQARTQIRIRYTQEVFR